MLRSTRLSPPSPRRRTVEGAAPWPTTHPRVRTRFAVEEDKLQSIVGGVPRLATPCVPAEAERPVGVRDGDRDREAAPRRVATAR